MDKSIIKDEFIKLGQLLKIVNEITNGAEAKMYLEENNVVVNGEPEKRRGRKIYPGYNVEINDTIYVIGSKNND